MWLKVKVPNIKMIGGETSRYSTRTRSICKTTTNYETIKIALAQEERLRIIYTNTNNIGAEIWKAHKIS